MKKRSHSERPVDITTRGVGQSHAVQCRIPSQRSGELSGREGAVDCRHFPETRDGWLWYCLSGLLALQHLYCKAVEERTQIEATVRRQESLLTNSKVTRRRDCSYCDPRGDILRVQDGCQQPSDIEAHSLLGAAVRSMQVDVLKYKRMVDDIEGIDQKGIVKVSISHITFWGLWILKRSPFISSDTTIWGTSVHTKRPL